MPPHRLFAISDIHLSNPENHAYFSTLPNLKYEFPPGSGLILAGDVGESILHLRHALEISLQVFKYVWWVPGNHELYTIPTSANSNPSGLSEQARKDATIDALKGEERYLTFVEECRKHAGVYTPEDEYQIWDCTAQDPIIITTTATSTPSTLESSPSSTHESNPSRALICPLFTLYDYTFRPSHIKTTAAALSWASEADTYATDEALLHPDPYPSREAWCHSLLSTQHARLSAARSLHPELPMVLINHWPLSQQVLHIPSIPRFSLWCGSTQTESWTREFAPVSVVVSGHLHVRRTDYIEGTRWEEVSLGYPRQWAAIRDEGLELAEVVREILPGPGIEERKRWEKPEGSETRWRKFGGR